MYSTHNEGKSVVAERLIGTLKNKIYKYMISVSKNLYINKLDGIVKKFLLLQKLRILLRGQMLLVILETKKLLERFTKKNCKKRIKNSLALKK